MKTTNRCADNLAHCLHSRYGSCWELNHKWTHSDPIPHSHCQFCGKIVGSKTSHPVAKCERIPADMKIGKYYFLARPRDIIIRCSWEHINGIACKEHKRKLQIEISHILRSDLDYKTSSLASNTFSVVVEINIKSTGKLKASNEENVDG